MRVLIITHIDFYSTYGAATSLRHHVELIYSDNSSENSEIIIINRVSFLKIIKGLWKGNQRKINDRITLIDFWSLPFEFNYDGSPEINPEARTAGLISKFKKVLTSVLYKNALSRIFSIIKTFGISVVHLNASVLAQVATDIKSHFGKDSPLIVMHIRDFLKTDLNRTNLINLSNVDRFICIDKATQDRLIESVKEFGLSKHYVLQNIFRKTEVQAVRQIKELTSIKAQNKFVIIGRISPLKGVLFVIDSFIKANLPNSILLVVGDGDGEYFAEFLKVCKQHPNTVKYLGEIPHLSETNLYYDTDFLIRGDESFRTGRTVYEALIHGNQVILPGHEIEIEADSDLLPFKDEVLLYQPNSTSSLIESLRCCFKGRISQSSEDISSLFEEKRKDYLASILSIYPSAKA